MLNSRQTLDFSTAYIFRMVAVKIFLLVPLAIRELIQCESKKVAPLKLFAIFSLRLSIFP